jgi:hypothetical protein
MLTLGVAPRALRADEGRVVGRQHYDECIGVGAERLKR